MKSLYIKKNLAYFLIQEGIHFTPSHNIQNHHICRIISSLSFLAILNSFGIMLHHIEARYVDQITGLSVKISLLLSKNRTNPTPLILEKNDQFDNN